MRGGGKNLQFSANTVLAKRNRWRLLVSTSKTLSKINRWSSGAPWRLFCFTGLSLKL